MTFSSLTEADRERMLETIGVADIEDLFADIPAAVRFDRPLDVGPALTEQELVAHMTELAERNVRHRPRAVVPGRRHVRPLRAGGGRHW